MTNRRSFLLGLGALALAGAGNARLALASAPTDARLVVIVLRGAMDGLSAVLPYADPQYRDLRGALAIAEPDRRMARSISTTPSGYIRVLRRSRRSTIRSS